MRHHAPRTWELVVMAALLTLLFLLLLAESTARSRPAAPITRVPVAALPAPCPAHPPTLHAPKWVAARSELAPPGATAIRLCRYSGLNATPRSALVASALITRRARVARLVRRFDRLPAVYGVHDCPADDGSEIAVLLRYPRGRRLTIAVSLSGCRFASNGVLVRFASGIQPRLEALLARGS